MTRALTLTKASTSFLTSTNYKHTLSLTTTKISASAADSITFTKTITTTHKTFNMFGWATEARKSSCCSPTPLILHD
jgi:hypothetical protein